MVDVTDPNAGFFDQLQTPGNYGLLAAGLGILANARGPNSQNAIGAGALAGLQAAQSAQQNAYLNDYRKAQAAKLSQDARLNGAKIALFDRLGSGGGQSAGSPIASSDGSVPAGAMPQGGATANPITMNDVLTGKLLGIDLLPEYKYLSDGVQLQPGTVRENPITHEREVIPNLDKGQTFQFGPDKRTIVGVTNLPNAVNAAAQMAGATTEAQQAATAKYDLIPVPDGKGGTKLMPRSQAVGVLGGAGQRTGGLGTTPSQADQTFDESVAKAAADTYNNLQTSGMSADKQIANYQRVGQLLDGFEGGTLSNLGLQGAKLANSLDIKLDPNLGSKEAAVAIGNQLALQLRDPANGGGMPGAMSDADRNFLQASVPNLTQSNAGRKQLIEYQVKVLERNKDVATFARKWRQKYGRLDALDPNGNDFQTALSNWSANNPLFPQGQ